MAEAASAGGRAAGVAAGPAQGPDPAGPDRRRGPADRRGPRGAGQHPGDHRGGRHRLRVLLQPLRQQGAAVPDGLRGGAGTLGADDRPGHRRHQRPGRAVRRGHCGSPGGSAGPTPTSPGSSPAPAWTPWTSPSAWRRAPCATSRRGRPRAGSPFPMPRSRSAPWPAACSGCCGCASGTPNASTRPPSTSSPRPSCACSASPPTKPPASPPPRFLPSRPGNGRRDGAAVWPGFRNRHEPAREAACPLRLAAR